MLIYVVRHPYTKSNVQKITQGHSDSPLYWIGIIQAHILGMKLKNNEISKIITSDLGRCVQTSNIINKFLKVPITKTEKLREQNLGKYNGVPKSKIKEEFDEDDPKAIPKGGESLFQGKERVITYLKTMKDKDTVLIVTHSGCFQSILSEAYNIPLNDKMC